MITEYAEIKAWLDTMGIVNYEIHDTDTVTVKGVVNLNTKGLKIIPVQFRIVYGDFFCFANDLETLVGAPREIGGDFNCSSNKLKTLEGAPREVAGDFNCSGNRLETLEGSPRDVGGVFNCSNNVLKTLEYSPHEVGGYFFCRYNGFKIIPDCDTIVNGEIKWTY